MIIIKKFENFAGFKDYANQNPETIQNWRKGGSLTWRRILVAKTDQHEAVIFSENLIKRIYAWVCDLFRVFGDYYAKQLGANKVEFLEPSKFSPSVLQALPIAKEVFKRPQIPTKPVAQIPVAAPTAPTAPKVQPAAAAQPGAVAGLEANNVQLKRAEAAMAKADSMTRDEKLQTLDWIVNKVDSEKNKYAADELNNIKKTIQAAKQLIADSDWWEAYAVRIQNSRKNPPTDTLTPKEINDMIYGGGDENKGNGIVHHEGLGIVAHANLNDLAPVLRSFGVTFVSGLLAARELGQETEFLKYAVRGDDICLEGRTKSVGAWIENTVFTSIAIEVDPLKHDYVQAVHGYLVAFKETQLRQFYNEVYKKIHEGGLAAGYGEKMRFCTDSWKAYRLQLETDPRFYQQYFTQDRFLQFVEKETPQGMNLVKENGKPFANLNAGNILAAIEAAKAITFEDPFNMAEAHAHLKNLKETAIKKLDAKTAFSPTMKLAKDVARVQGYAILPRELKTNNYAFLLFSPKDNIFLQITLNVIAGGGIKIYKPGTSKRIKIYYPNIEDFFKSLDLKWEEV